jgi:hypothetical protein
LSGGDWILTLEHSVSRHRGVGEKEKKRKREEEKKRKKKKKEEQQGCHLWGPIWDEICQIFFIYYFFS